MHIKGERKVKDTSVEESKEDSNEDSRCELSKQIKWYKSRKAGYGRERERHGKQYMK